MRILVIAHRMPFPPNKGDKIRAFNVISRLARRHDVYVASLIDEAADVPHVGRFESHVRKFLYERIDRRRRPVSALKSLPFGRSITVTHFYSSALQARLDALLDEIDVDAVLCSSSPTAEYVFRSRHAGGKLARAVKVMDLIDVDSYKWAQYAARSGPGISWVYRYEANRLAAYEARIGATFDRLLLVSEQECGYFPRGKGLPAPTPGKLRAMSNGVDLDYFSPAPALAMPASPPTLVFTGVMDYWPNVEGVTWFVDRVWPAIQAGAPGARVQIVGSRPTKDVQRLGTVPGVTVTGFVEDVRDYLGAATACIAPLRIARGVQNKVLEAMAMGRAVVTTPQAFEGLRAENGRDIVVAEGEAAFAEAVLGLLRDPARATQIGHNARLCVEAQYNWDENLRELEAMLAGAHGAPEREARGHQEMVPQAPRT